MSTNLVPGRHTAALDGAVVVFLLGARINAPWKVHHWWPIVRAMPRMIAELEANPELGLLGHQAWFGRTTLMLQYWRSPEHLLRYAHAGDAEHLPAWRAFQRRSRATDAVGIWHETYVVPAGASESIYVDMPPTGLGRVAPLVEARGRRAAAAGRLGRAA